MKTTLLFAITFIHVCTFSQTWEQQPDFPATERDDATVFVIDNFAYCGTGMVPWFVPFADFYKFDMNTNSWSTIASLPTSNERQYAVGFSHTSKGYVFGGSNGTVALNDLWEYDPTTNEWTEKTSLPASGISGACGFVIADTAYIIGGRESDGTTLSSVWAYSFATNSWVQKNDLPFGLWRASAIANNSQGYLLHGKNESNESNSTLLDYQPITDSWNSSSTFPASERSYSIIHTINNHLITGFGIDDLGNYYNDLWSFDLTNNTWNSLPSSGISERKGGIGFSHNESIFYATGINSSNERLKDTWKYIPTLAIKSIVNIQISVFPNPVSKNLTIQSDYEITEIKLMNILGEFVLSQSNHPIIDVSNLQSGTYFIDVQTVNGSVTRKISVVH